MVRLLVQKSPLDDPGLFLGLGSVAQLLDLLLLRGLLDGLEGFLQRLFVFVSLDEVIEEESHSVLTDGRHRLAFPQKRFKGRHLVGLGLFLIIFALNREEANLLPDIRLLLHSQISPSFKEVFDALILLRIGGGLAGSAVFVGALGLLEGSAVAGDRLNRLY